MFILLLFIVVITFTELCKIRVQAYFSHLLFSCDFSSFSPMELHPFNVGRLPGVPSGRAGVCCVLSAFAFLWDSASLPTWSPCCVEDPRLQLFLFISSHVVTLLRRGPEVAAFLCQDFERICRFLLTCDISVVETGSNLVGESVVTDFLSYFL